MPRFNSYSQSNGYADVQALYQLTAAAASSSSSRGSSKKVAPPQRKPRHLEPVPAKQLGASSLLSQCRNQQQPHLLDPEECSISSKQLRSLVSTTVTIDRQFAPKSANESVKYQHVLRQPHSQQQPNQHVVDPNESFRRRSRSNNSGSRERRKVDAVLSKLDAGGYSSRPVVLKLASSTVAESQQREEEEGQDDEADGDPPQESSGMRNPRYSAHVRALQELKQHHNIPTKTPQSNQAWMQAIDLSSMHGTTLARYRRLVGMVVRKNLLHILASVAQNVALIRKQHRCAARIQVLVREFLLRRCHEHITRRESSAVIVQCAWRCRQALIEVAALQNDRIRRIALQEVADFRDKRAATRIQRNFRAHATWKLWTRRRDRACRTLIVTWRGKKLRQQAQTNNESGERRLPRNPEECEFAAQGCGDELHVDVTQYQKSDLVAPDPRDLQSQPAAGDVAEEPCAAEAHELREVVSLVSAEQSAPLVPKVLLVPNQQREDTEVNLPPVMGFHIPLAGKLEDNSNRNVVRMSVSTEVGVIESESRGENLTGAYSHSSGTLRGFEEPKLRSESKIQVSELKATAVQELPTRLSVGFGGDTSRAVGSSSTPELPCRATSEAASPTQKSEVAIAAERVLARFLARWKECYQEAARRERDAESRVCVKVQSQVRRWIAVNRVRVVRQLAIRSLRAQLESAWLSSRLHATDQVQSAANEAFGEDEEDAADSDNNSSDEEQELSLSDQTSKWTSGKASCSAFLPMRNGGIPPGVQLQQLEATSFWKWSWSAEAWTTMQ